MHESFSLLVELATDAIPFLSLSAFCPQSFTHSSLSIEHSCRQLGSFSHSTLQASETAEHAFMHTIVDEDAVCTPCCVSTEDCVMASASSIGVAENPFGRQPSEQLIR